MCVHILTNSLELLYMQEMTRLSHYISQLSMNRLEDVSPFGRYKLFQMDIYLISQLIFILMTETIETAPIDSKTRSEEYLVYPGKGKVKIHFP